MVAFIRITTKIIAGLAIFGSFILAIEMSTIDGSTDWAWFISYLLSFLTSIVIFIMLFLGFAQIIENSEESKASLYYMRKLLDDNYIKCENCDERYDYRRSTCPSCLSHNEHKAKDST
jgi:uncharacterized membrane protein